MTVPDDSGIVSDGDKDISSNYGSLLESQELEKPSSTKQGFFFRMDRDKKIILMLLLGTRLLFGAYTMFMIPFFPTAAEKKGLSGAAIGFVLSCWDLFVVIFAPIVGALYGRLGPKKLFLWGLMLGAISNLLFPLVEFSPPGAAYVACCVLIRVLGGMAGAAYKTAAYATLAKLFPDNVAAMFATIEVFAGLGFLLGPLMGGGLYEAGGFALPFLVMGGLIAVSWLLSICLLPEIDASEDENPEKTPSFKPLLRQPVVLLNAVLVIIFGLTTTFMDLAMTMHYGHRYHLQPSMIGLLAMMASIINLITHPLWGIVADKFPNHNYQLVCVGFAVPTVALIFNGPAPFLYIKPVLWLNIVCQAVYFATLGSPSCLFRTLNTAARNLGHGESTSEGIVGSLYTFLFSLGAFVGPFVGGGLLDAIGFPWACMVFSGINFIGTLMLIVHLIIARVQREIHRGRERHVSDTVPLLYTKITAIGNKSIEETYEE